MVFESGSEEIMIDTAHDTLNTLFDKKLASLDSKVSNIMNELDRARAQFIEACDNFEELEDEPNTEDIWNPNINFIKSQKNLYAKALKKVVEQSILKVDNAPNIHSKYTRILSNLENTNNEILKTNARFKIVMSCYSNHLRDFKRSMSNIERLTASIENEINRRERELLEYNVLREQISNLSIQTKKLEALGNRITLLRNQHQNYSSPIENEEKEVITKLESRKAEQMEIHKEVLRLQEKIAFLTMPLERASKKFDHISAKKRQLYSFISDPINTIDSESAYSEFKDMIKELKENINLGKIDVKNTAKVNEIASSLLTADIYSLIHSFKTAQSKKQEIENEVRALERRSDDIKNRKMNAENAVHSAETMEKEENELKTSIKSIKNDVEKLFLDSYNKRISIIL